MDEAEILVPSGSAAREGAAPGLTTGKGASRAPAALEDAAREPETLGDLRVGRLVEAPRTPVDADHGVALSGAGRRVRVRHAHRASRARAHQNAAQGRQERGGAGTHLRRGGEGREEDEARSAEDARNTSQAKSRDEWGTVGSVGAYLGRARGAAARDAHVCLSTRRAGHITGDFAPRTHATHLWEAAVDKPRENLTGRRVLLFTRSLAFEKNVQSAARSTRRRDAAPRAAHTTARATMSAPTRARVASRAYGAPPRARTRAPTSRVARGARPLTTRRRVVLRRVAPVDSGEDVDVTAEPSAADAWRIRPADPDDIPAVVAAAAVSGVDWSPSQIAEEQARGALLVAVPAADTATDTPIAGLVVAWVVADVEVQILEVAVHPTLRRRGLGARLVRAALDLAPAVDATLEVRASNDAALRLYESCGFSRVGERAGYYADGEDAVLMTRTPPVVSARELTRLLAGLSPEDARKPAPKTPEEKQRGETMHPQDYPRERPAFRRDATGAGGGAGGRFKMRNRARGGFRRKTANPETET